MYEQSNLVGSDNSFTFTVLLFHLEGFIVEAYEAFAAGSVVWLTLCLVKKHIFLPMVTLGKTPGGLGIPTDS